MQPGAGPGYPPQPGPPRRNGRRIGLLIVGILGGLFTLLTVLTLVAVLVVIPKWHASSPGWLAETAIQRLDRAAIEHYQGTFIDESGRTVQLDAFVSGQENRSMGTQAIDGHRAEFVSSTSGTYLKGDLAYWNIVDPASAGVYAGRWVNAGVAELRMRVSPLLLPPQLAATLREEFVDGGGKLTKGSERRIDGVRTARITASDQGAVYVSLRSPYRLARVEGAIVGGKVSTGRNAYAFDVAEPSDAEASAFDARFRDFSQLTSTALNPDKPETMPAYYVIEGLIDGGDDDCGPNSCLLRADVKNVHGAAVPGQRPKLIGVIKAGKDREGAAIGRCETTLPPMKPEQPTKVSCVVSDPRWARWTRQGAENWYSWNFITFNPGWDGADPRLASQLFEGESKAGDINDVVGAGGGLALKAYARLLRYPGVRPADAVAIVTAAAKQDHLDLIDGYASSGRLGNPTGLKTLMAALALGQNDRSGSADALWQLHEAAARAKSGTGPVALGSWTPPGAKAAVGQADVLDTARKEAIGLAAVSEAGAPAVVTAITKTPGRLGKAPAGYQRLVQVHIADSRNPLHALGKAELRDALRKQGLTAAALKDVKQVVIVNGQGRHTYAPSDFR
jgi:hypothetical protein